MLATDALTASLWSLQTPLTLAGEGHNGQLLLLAIEEGVKHFEEDRQAIELDKDARATPLLLLLHLWYAGWM